MDRDEDEGIGIPFDAAGLGCWLLMLGLPFLAGMFVGGWLVVQASAR